MTIFDALDGQHSMAMSMTTQITNCAWIALMQGYGVTVLDAAGGVVEQRDGRAR